MKSYVLYRGILLGTIDFLCANLTRALRSGLIGTRIGDQIQGYMSTIGVHSPILHEEPKALNPPTPYHFHSLYNIPCDCKAGPR